MRQLLQSMIRFKLRHEGRSARVTPTPLWNTLGVRLIEFLNNFAIHPPNNIGVRRQRWHW
ncbi:hypothetical protein HanIR_Chr04g0154101 [Helianthus annuus]|nr:hypothetical protein HanIR_Chr04g0154101 [Helianthus annuus]